MEVPKYDGKFLMNNYILLLVAIVLIIGVSISVGIAKHRINIAQNALNASRAGITN